MTAPTLFDLDDPGPVCRCSRCVRRQEERWPDWAAPQAASDWRDVETVKVAEGRL